MDSRQEIGLGASVAASQAYAYSTGRSEEVTQQSIAVSSAGSSGRSSAQQGGEMQTTINPRTVLDPDMYVNVAKFSFGQGAVEFQVPSKSQLEAYQRNQSSEEAQVEADQAQTRIEEARVREANDGDGIGDETGPASGTVTAAVVSQTQGGEQAQTRSNDNRGSGSPSRRVVNVDA
jgi:hypothetical protein